MTIRLRPYQRRLLDDARNAIRSGRKHPILHMATGGGKTIVACELIRLALAKGSRVFFLADRAELIDQTSRALDDCGINHGVIKSGHPRVRPQKPVQVGSIQTLDSRLRRDTHKLPPPDMVVLDECHDNLARHRRIIDYIQPRHIVGLTATPYRADGKGLGAIFDAIVSGPPILELIRLGALVPWQVFAPPVRLDLSEVRIKRGDYDPSQLADALNTRTLIGSVVDEYQRLASDRRALAFCCDVRHAVDLAQAFLDAGIPAGVVHGGLSSHDRARVLGLFRSGALRVLASCDLLNKGYDDPGLDCLILARPTRSRALWRQQLGRGSRPAPGKADCIVLDHANATAQHGHPADEDAVDLDGVKKRPRKGVEEAPAERAEERPITLIEGVELEPVTPDDAKSRAFAKLVATAYAKGYKPGWVLHRFRQQYNTWPRSKDLRAAPHRMQRIDNKWQWT